MKHYLLYVTILSKPNQLKLFLSCYYYGTSSLILVSSIVTSFTKTSSSNVFVASSLSNRFSLKNASSSGNIASFAHSPGASIRTSPSKNVSTSCIGSSFIFAEDPKGLTLTVFVCSRPLSCTKERPN